MDGMVHVGVSLVDGRKGRLRQSHTLGKGFWVTDAVHAMPSCAAPAAQVRLATFSQHHVDGLDLALTPLQVRPAGQLLVSALVERVSVAGLSGRPVHLPFALRECALTAWARLRWSSRPS